MKASTAHCMARSTLDTRKWSRGCWQTASPTLIRRISGTKHPWKMPRNAITARLSGCCERTEQVKSSGVAPFQRDERNKLVDQIRGQQARYTARRVVGRHDLDQIKANDVDPNQAANQLQALCAGEAPNFRCARCRRIGPVNKIAFDGETSPPAPN